MLFQAGHRLLHVVATALLALVLIWSALALPQSTVPNFLGRVLNRGQREVDLSRQTLKIIRRGKLLQVLQGVLKVFGHLYKIDVVKIVQLLGLGIVSICGYSVSTRMVWGGSL